MYGLPLSGDIANDKLNLYLSKFGYKPSPITPGLCRNQTCSLQFSMVVDEFGIKCEQQEDIIHLLDSLKKNYKIYEDWDGKL